jgi:hypothetical protein
MSNPDWAKWTDDLCAENQCSDDQIVTLMRHVLDGTKPFEARHEVRILERKQKEIKQAVAAVQKAYEANPNASREELKKAAYKNITGSVILSFLIYAMMSVVVKMAIEWLLDRLFSN